MNKELIEQFERLLNYASDGEGSWRLEGGSCYIDSSLDREKLIEGLSTFVEHFADAESTRIFNWLDEQSEPGWGEHRPANLHDALGLSPCFSVSDCYYKWVEQQENKT